MADIAKRWEKIRNEYLRYIRFERRLSENSIEAYMRDLEEFTSFITHT